MFCKRCHMELYYMLDVANNVTKITKLQNDFCLDCKVVEHLGVIEYCPKM